MRSDMITLCMHVSITALANFQRPEVMFLADGVLASSARHFPPEASITVLAQCPRTCLLLQL